MFSFRIRFHRSSSNRLQVRTKELDLPSETGSVRLIGCDAETVELADTLVVKGSGFDCEETAQRAGERYLRAMKITLPRYRVGVDFGDRAGKGFATKRGLDMLVGDKRSLNDVHGLMVFETEPPPVFARVNPARAIISSDPTEFGDDLKQALAAVENLPRRVFTAAGLFHGAQFEDHPDPRLLLYVSAVEAMVECEPRPEASSDHVAELIESTKQNKKLTSSERGSLLGALEWLRNESIAQACKRFIRERLGGREYDGMSAPKFFRKCYDVRSDIVHGAEELPKYADVSRNASNLELLVRDLLWSEVEADSR